LFWYMPAPVMRNRIWILKISISGKRYNRSASERTVKGTGRNNNEVVPETEG
jgi:hypothetical protein